MATGMAQLKEELMLWEEEMLARTLTSSRGCGGGGLIICVGVLWFLWGGCGAVGCWLVEVWGCGSGCGGVGLGGGGGFVYVGWWGLWSCGWLGGLGWGVGVGGVGFCFVGLVGLVWVGCVWV
ncbi:hypothetical protein Tco_0522199 [Tanacetum coccineum]